MNKINKLLEYKKPILIAVIQWFITTIFQVDRLYFTYDQETKYFLTTKFLYLVLLLISWCFIFEVRKKIKEGNVVWKRGFFVFKVYFSFMMLLLLILWPGTWSWDDLWTLFRISSYNSWDAWQHILTGLFHSVLLQILPFPGGIILLRNAIIAVCVAFTVTKLEISFHIVRLKNPVVDTIVKILPFLLPPVLMYQFSGYRMGVYVYLELVMLIMFICSAKDEKAWSLPYLLTFTVLCTIVSTWRTESFVYVPCTFLLILFISKNIISNKRKLLCIAILVIGFVGINKCQNLQLENSNYEIISLMRPCTELIRIADPEEDASELAVIDKVTNLEVIQNNPTLDGTALYWNTDCVRNRNDNPDDDYTDEDYHNYLKAFIKLSLKYPKVVIAERWNLFIMGSGFTGETSSNIAWSSSLFEENNNIPAAQATFEKGWIANSPVFKTMRRTLIYILGNTKSDGTVIMWQHRIIWNAIIPELILLCAWLKMLIQRKWFFAGICTAVLIRLPIVILTQPAGWLMYVLSFYFLGYVFLVYELLIQWSGRRCASTDKIA